MYRSLVHCFGSKYDIEYQFYFKFLCGFKPKKQSNTYVYSKHIQLITYRKSFEREFMPRYMGTSDVFQVLKIARAAGECNLRTWKNHEWPYITKCKSGHTIFFIYNILNKIIIKKKKQEKRPSRNSEMASKLLTYLMSTNHLQLFDS